MQTRLDLHCISARHFALLFLKHLVKAATLLAEYGHSAKAAHHGHVSTEPISCKLVQTRLGAAFRRLLPVIARLLFRPLSHAVAATLFVWRQHPVATQPLKCPVSRLPHPPQTDKISFLPRFRLASTTNRSCSRHLHCFNRPDLFVETHEPCKERTPTSVLSCLALPLYAPVWGVSCGSTFFQKKRFFTLWLRPPTRLYPGHFWHFS